MALRMTESGAHLTTSRVNRLLRPLRNKCNSLAALSKTATASRVAYSKQSSHWDSDTPPPLMVLYPSAGTKRLTIGRRSADDFELSRRVHAVCDAFKNITHVAFGRPCSDRIPSLAVMCTLVVGENMPIATSDGALVDSGGDSDDEDNRLDIDDIYEAVPPHHRRSTVVSHALSMILCICAHHHTLVTILLDHCLSFGLVHESTHLLKVVLGQAFLPSNPSYPPSATHPAHTNYLLDLHTKWTTGNYSFDNSQGSLLFTTSVFCHAVLNAMSQSPSPNLHVLWTSKVLNRLLHAVEGCDIDSYIVIVRALSRNFWEISGPSDDIQHDAQLAILRDKLSELLSSLFDLLFTQRDSRSSTPTLSRIYAVIDMLSDCRAARLHCLRMTVPGSFVDLPDMIMVFATHVFVAFRDCTGNFDQLLAILEDSSPIPTTFSKLMVHLSRPQESQTFEDFVDGFIALVKKYSSTFRSENLFGLDASLWACALHHFGTSIASSPTARSMLVARYKQQLMEAVDAAERRCFGRDANSSPPISLPTRLNRAKHAQRGRVSGHWEWEDMVGSWIRKTPVHKKRKVDNDRPHTPSRPIRSCLRDTTISKVVPGPLSSSTPLSICRRRLSTLSPSSSYSQLSDPTSLLEDGSEYQDVTDKENYPSNPSPMVRQTHSIKRRSSNFFSLLADAQTNRILLHSNLDKPSSSVIPEKYASQESQHAPPKREQKASRRKVTLPPAQPGTLFPSDDSLDLFAYATSSPAQC